MKTFLLAIVCASTLSLGTAIAAQSEELTAESAYTNTTDPTAKNRASIGLVFGGGSARGLAHIGVIQALEELRVPVDVMSGSSMGSVIGGLYAAGFTPNEIADFAITQDWFLLFDDQTGRRSETFRRKTDDIGFLTDFRITFKDGNLVLPQGVIQGQRLFLELSTRLSRARGINNFVDLSIPFHPVAMNLSTGEEVILKSGDLATAVLASMSLPGLLPPVNRDGQILIDGGFVNNLPISIARGMGADIVIAIGVGADPQSADDIESFSGVLRQTQILMMNENINRQKASLIKSDYLIAPSLDEYNFASFADAKTIIERGKQAVMDRQDEFTHLQLSEKDWALHLSSRKSIVSGETKINSIQIQQDSNLADSIIRNNIRFKAGDILDPQLLGEDIDRLYALELFDQISYEFDFNQPESTLLLKASAKKSSDGFYRLGVGLDSNLDDNTEFEIGVSFTKPQVNQWGGEYRAKVTIGDKTGFTNEFYQPFGDRQQFFFEPSLVVSRDQSNFFNDANQLSGKRRLSLVQGTLSAGVLFGRWAEFRGGFTLARGDFTLTDDTLSTLDIGNEVKDASVFAQLSIDSLDDLSYPTTGTFALLRHEEHDETAGGSLRYSETEFLLVNPITRGKNTLTFVSQINSSSGRDVSLITSTTLGGFLSLSGFSESELIGNHSLLLSANYYRRFNDRSLLFDMPLFLGGSIEVGNVFDDRLSFALDDQIIAGSIFAAIDSPIGPVFIGYGLNDADESRAYFSIGSFF